MLAPLHLIALFAPKAQRPAISFSRIASGGPQSWHRSASQSPPIRRCWARLPATGRGHDTLDPQGREAGSNHRSCRTRPADCRRDAGRPAEDVPRQLRPSCCTRPRAGLSCQAKRYFDGQGWVQPGCMPSRQGGRRPGPVPVCAEAMIATAASSNCPRNTAAIGPVSENGRPVIRTVPAPCVGGVLVRAGGRADGRVGALVRRDADLSRPRSRWRRRAAGEPGRMAAATAAATRRLEAILSEPPCRARPRRAPRRLPQAAGP